MKRPLRCVVDAVGAGGDVWPVHTPGSRARRETTEQRTLHLQGARRETKWDRS